MSVEHNYPDFQILLHSFLCKVENTNIVLTEHVEVQWLEIENMGSLDWAEADIPIVQKLQVRK